MFFSRPNDSSSVIRYVAQPSTFRISFFSDIAPEWSRDPKPSSQCWMQLSTFSPSNALKTWSCISSPSTMDNGEMGWWGYASHSLGTLDTLHSFIHSPTKKEKRLTTRAGKRNNRRSHWYTCALICSSGAYVQTLSWMFEVQEVGIS